MVVVSDEAKEFNELVEKQNTIIENYLEEIGKNTVRITSLPGKRGCYNE